MNPQPVADAAKPEHAVAVLGFNPTEQRVLASIFDMSAKRAPKFVRQWDETGTPDVFLVDADDANAMTALHACNRDRRIPVILIGIASAMIIGIGITQAAHNGEEALHHLDDDTDPRLVRKHDGFMKD